MEATELREALAQFTGTTRYYLHRYIRTPERARLTRATRIRSLLLAAPLALVTKIVTKSLIKYDPATRRDKTILNGKEYADYLKRASRARKTTEPRSPTP